MTNYLFHVRIKILMLNIFNNGENNIPERYVGLYFNCGIELNQKMLILKRFVAKFFFFFMSGSRKLILNIFKNGKKLNIRSIVWSFVLIVWLNWRFVAKTDLFMWWWQLNCLWNTFVVLSCVVCEDLMSNYLCLNIVLYLLF